MRPFILTCFGVLPFHGGMNIRGSEIEDFDKIVKPITKNQSNRNKNLQQEKEKIKARTKINNIAVIESFNSNKI